jgi:thioredoxin 1
MVQEIHSYTEFKHIIGTNDKVVVDFYADWCGPCKKIAPFIKKLSEEYTKIIFIKVNVDNVSEITDVYNVKALPTFMFFKKGQVQEQLTIVGSKTETISEVVGKF